MSKQIEIPVNVPMSLSAITLGQYQDYIYLLEKNKDDENAADFLNKKALEIFCGLSLKESYNLPLKHFLFIVEHLGQLFSTNTPLERHFKFKDPEGKEQLMGFIPNIEKMTFGEYADATEYFPKWEDAHKLMAVLFRPVEYLSGERYKIRKYEGTSTYAEAMRSMPVNIAFGARLFFYRLASKLSRGILKSLEQNQELLSKSKEILPNGGVGIQAFMLSQEVMFQDLMKRQRFHSEKL